MGSWSWNGGKGASFGVLYGWFGCGWEKHDLFGGNFGSFGGDLSVLWLVLAERTGLVPKFGGV